MLYSSPACSLARAKPEYPKSLTAKFLSSRLYHFHAVRPWAHFFALCVLVLLSVSHFYLIRLGGTPAVTRVLHSGSCEKDFQGLIIIVED